MLISWALPATESLLRCHAHVTRHMTRSWQQPPLAHSAALRPWEKQAADCWLLATADTQTQGSEETGLLWRHTRALEISGDLSVSWLTLLIPAESSPSRIPETSVRSRAVARWCGALLWNTRNDGEVKSICWIFRKMRLRKKFCGSASTGTGGSAFAVSTFGHTSYLTPVWSYLFNIHMM